MQGSARATFFGLLAKIEGDEPLDICGVYQRGGEVRVLRKVFGVDRNRTLKVLEQGHSKSGGGNCWGRCSFPPVSSPQSEGITESCRSVTSRSGTRNRPKSLCGFLMSADCIWKCPQRGQVVATQVQICRQREASIAWRLSGREPQRCARQPRGMPQDAGKRR
jgi:hypothetical protein